MEYALNYSNTLVSADGQHYRCLTIVDGEGVKVNGGATCLDVDPDGTVDDEIAAQAEQGLINWVMIDDGDSWGYLHPSDVQINRPW